MTKKIVSKDNKLFKKLKSLNRSNIRKKEKLFLIEGKKMFLEASKSKANLDSIIISERFSEIIPEEYSEKIIILKNSLFDEITEMQNSEQIIAVCKIEDNKPVEYDQNLLVLDGIRDPGNMGTIIRTAESFNYNNIILINNCVDIFNNKVLRSTMGSIFRVNIIKGSLELLKDIKKHYKIYSMELSNGSESIYNMTEVGKHAIIIGNESNGVSEEVSKFADKKLIIPISENVESLNAGVAASLTMFYFNFINTKMEKKAVK